MSEIDDLFNKSKEFRDNKDYNSAIDILNKIIDLEPANQKAYVELGHAQGNLKQYDDALNSFERALAILENSDALTGQGLVYYYMDNLEDAITSFTKALDYNHEDTQAAYYLSRCYYKKQDYKQALVFLNQVVSIDPDSLDAWNDMGVINSILKDEENALKAFLEVLRIDNEYVPALYNMATTLADLKRYDEALECLDRLVIMDNNNYKSHFYRANVLFFMEKPQESLDSFKLALRLDDTQAEVWNYQGCVQASMGDTDKAIVSLRRAIELDNNYSAPYLNLGLVYKSLNKEREAKRCFNKVLKLSPEMKETLKPLM